MNGTPWTTSFLRLLSAGYNYTHALASWIVTTVLSATVARYSLPGGTAQRVQAMSAGNHVMAGSLLHRRLKSAVTQSERRVYDPLPDPQD
jgi:hypothetical protein